jgi:predicted transposase YbfD/YdcC
MMSDNKEIENLYITLTKLEDPRDKRGVRYKLCDLVLLLIYGILSGMGDAMGVEYYVEEHFDYFKGLIGLKQVPSHDTFSRILRLINFEKLSDTLSEWLNTYYPEQVKYFNGKKVMHIDGKAVKAASKKSEGEKPVYLMNSMYEGGSISLVTEKIGDKENEISFIPKYLERFNLKDTIITIDAIGCNKNIIEYITSHKGNFILPVKENQKKLYNSIEKEIKRLKEIKEYDNLDKAEKKIKDHGRIESYSSIMISDTKFLYDEYQNKSFYGEIARIGVIEKITSIKENGKWKESKNISYVITDLETISIENLQNIKLSHWGIEANHWLLDVQLNEDRLTSREDNATVNASILKRFCIRIKKQATDFKDKPLKRMLVSGCIYPEKISKILFIDIA